MEVSMKKLAFFILLLAHCALYPYIYQIQTLVCQRPDGTKQYVHLLADIHVCLFKHADTQKTAECGQAQREELIKGIKQLNTSALVITEDMYALCELDALDAKEDFLDSLSKICCLHNVNALNVECRTEHLMQKHIDALKTFNDTQELNAYYKKIINQFSIEPLTTIDILVQADTHAVDVVDAHALHAIISNPRVDHIFVCAGQTHCQNICLRLQGDPGFVKIDEQTVSEVLQFLYEYYAQDHPEELEQHSDAMQKLAKKQFLDLCYQKKSIIAPYFKKFIEKYGKQPVPLARL